MKWIAPLGLPEETLPNETYFGFLTFLTLRQQRHDGSYQECDHLL